MRSVPDPIEPSRVRKAVPGRSSDSISVSIRTEPEEGPVESDAEIMEIIAAYDLTGLFMAAAELRGVPITRRGAECRRPGRVPARRPQAIDALPPHVEGEDSKGKIRGDKGDEMRHVVRRGRGSSPDAAIRP